MDEAITRLAVERLLQLCAQVCIDIANYLIAQLDLRTPDEQTNIFIILGQEKIIPFDLAERMTGLVRFRNILVHEYVQIDDRQVYRHLKENLGDFEAFAQAVFDRFVAGAA
ncbi:MAG: DUF86 domain-containing protein [Anaerolineae bacterium]|nr:DUF86 domain-containing protein [Anaerolineae bacterium]